MKQEQRHNELGKEVQATFNLTGQIPDLVSTMEYVEDDGQEPDGVVANAPVVVDVLAVGGASLPAGDNVGQGRVRVQEEGEGHMASTLRGSGRLAAVSGGGSRKRER
jgi:hypothetical protein